MDSPLRFRLLGRLEVLDDSGSPLTITRRKVRSLLAILLLKANSAVPTASLVDQLWNHRPPKSALANLQSYVSELRRVLGAADGGGTDRLRTRQGGYQLDVGDGELDATRFTRLAELGARRLGEGTPATAVEHLSAALELWRGPVLDGLEPPALLQPDLEQLDELRLKAAEGRAQAWLDLGCNDIAAAELRSLTAKTPLRERLWELLMLANYRGGRTGEALAVYQRARTVLVEQLGVEPGPALRRVQRAVLDGDPSLDLVPALQGHGWIRPRQLPPDSATVIGRGSQLSALDELLLRHDGPGVLPVALVVGPAGAGKTTLAVHWAHRVTAAFPDGQLFVDLQGHSSTPALGRLEVLTRFLHALGVPPTRVPSDPDDAAALYRSLLSARRLLVVLDNAASADQVRGLLPGGPGCAVLITSRHRLAGVETTLGATSVRVGELSADDSLTLLTAVVGPDRIAADVSAARELTELCAGLPLALRIVAANLVLWPEQTLADYRAELVGTGLVARLTVPGDERLGLGSAFDLSYDAVSPPAARMFCLLGLVPGADISLPTAAAVAGFDAGTARQVLRELVAGHLVQSRAPDRFGMHDLLRDYAAARAREQLSGSARDEALRRLFTHFLRIADRAAAALYPDLLRLPVDEPPAPPLDPAEARQWLLAEHANMLAAIRWAAEHGPLPYSWRLADVLRGFFHSHRLDAAWEAAASAGLAAAERAGDRHAIGAMRHSLGALEWSRGAYRRALTELEAAKESYEGGGAREGVDSVQHALGVVHLDLGRLDRATEHFTTALAATEERGAALRVANGLINLGAVLIERGRLAEGIRHNRRALGICRRLGSPHAAAIALCNLGYGYRATGELDRALEVLTEARKTLAGLGSRDDEADVLVRLAAVHHAFGSFATARSCAHEALRAARETGNRRFEADSLCTLGDVHSGLGGEDSGHGHYLEALRLANRIGYRRGEIVAALGLSAADPQAATDYAAAALRTAERGGFGLLAGQARTRLAEALLAAGDPAAADGHASRAFEELRASGHVLGQARALIVRGTIRSGRADPVGAREYWLAAGALLGLERSTPIAAELRALLATGIGVQPGCG
ncbi:BTAD domain-containing putative transcriptional regulator [Amycolatopsis sp. A133]|uniref:AfsR/SARP family transcriptional regulator n=1 Tax=Amycolatopsis sp. A133 TaxID=3064472 RepID=UPI0027F8A1DC|nr:BTAD domain-containing putative transcriptional regulator [Amycolatopsis sp. A133]MDQ7807604.1 BTAD domain-containing putative transcriptional regulator [Amycolatopsis sp. A133]